MGDREQGLSERRVCGVVGMEPRVYRYRSSRPDDADLRKRLRTWQPSAGASAIAVCTF